MKTLFFILSFIVCLSFSFAQPGTLDESFGTKGKVLYQDGMTNLTLGVNCIQKDGKILQAGSRVIIARYNEDGTLDLSFGINGIVHSDFTDRGYFSGSTSAITTQNDGKILVAAYFNNSQFISYTGIIRYLPNGTLDSSFGVNGVTTTAFMNTGHRTAAYTNAITADANNNILITGQYSPQDEDGGTVDAITLRYLPDGKSDLTFGDSGLVRIHLYINGKYNVTGTYDIQTQADGKIILGGGSSTVGPTESKFMLIRLFKNGGIDSTFGDNGFVFTKFANNDNNTINSILLQPDEKILAAGSTDVNVFLGKTNIALARYNNDGTLDNSFGDKGLVQTTIKGYGAWANDMVLQQNGKIVVGGFLSQGISYTVLDFLLYRYNSNGSTDSTFGNNGMVTTDFSDIAGQNSYDYLRSINLDKDGNIVASGTNETQFPTPDNFAIARYIGDPVHQSLITRIKRWIIKHILHFQDPNAENTAYYVIEKSSNSTANFKEVARVEKSAISSQSPVDNQQSETYSFVLPASDNRDPTSDNFYRIKAVHNNGSVTYSDVIADNGLTDTPINGLTISPNPVKNVLHVQGLSAENKTSLSIINPEGNVIKKISVRANSYDFNVSQLKQGTYYLKAENNKGSKTFQFIKE